MTQRADVLLFNAEGKFAALLAFPEAGRGPRFVLPFGRVEGDESPWDAAIRGVTNLTTLDMMAGEAFWQIAAAGPDGEPMAEITFFLAQAEDWMGDAEVVDRKAYYPSVFWISPAEAHRTAEVTGAEPPAHLTELFVAARTKGLLPEKG